MKTSRALLLLALGAAVLLPATASASGLLDGFLDEIDVRASKDMGSFRADLTVTFDVSRGTVDGLFQVMSSPSDVYMCLRLGQVADVPIERVVEEHRNHAGQGWGVIAKNLGIQPGSDEFHALREGRLPAESGGHSSAGKSHGHGKG